MKKATLCSLILLILSCYPIGKIIAQQTLIEAKIDVPAILIGEQTRIKLTVFTDNGRNVQLLLPRDTIIRGIEILGMSKPDTVQIENNRIAVSQDILITSFDSALYSIPPFTVVDGADTILSKEPLGLKVSTVQVDIDNPDKFYDIADVWKPPFVLADYYPLIFGVLIALLLICITGYIIQRIRKKKTILPFIANTPERPPHEQAIMELNQIKQQKLWQQGRVKEFYTLVTETLRRYIAIRFNIGAMEMTSAEVLHVIRRENEADSVYDNINQILQLADFVKFAKLNPQQNENELSLMNAYLFVNQTKETDYSSLIINEEEHDEKETVTQQQTNN
ncbi:MAG: hypothetical protein LBC81_00245 [Tannerellaceae bacterium]|jgi:hypothetical protein|nr:hypothetical protein [Tannerellaceae bacterium]